MVIKQDMEVNLLQQVWGGYIKPLQIPYPHKIWGLIKSKFDYIPRIDFKSPSEKGSMRLILNLFDL